MDDKRYIVNTFSQGLITDADVSLLKNNSFSRSQNLRLYQDENGMVLTNIKGNKYSSTDKIGFKITEGYVPLGGCELNNILYVFSCKRDWVSDTTHYHRGEIGCFPSLNGSVWENVYRPLDNFYEADGTTKRTEGFQTDELHFDIDYLIEAFAWELVDGSVNLYFTDYLNPIRCINNGFRSDGTANGVKYLDSYFPNAVSLVLSGNTSLQVGLPTVANGGKLKGGNYFFFFRYANYQMNPTHFIVESRPVQIGDGFATLKSVQGSFNQTSKKVTFTLSDIDPAYDYIQVGYVRYFSDEKGDQVFETALVNQDYVIPTTSLTKTISLTLTILGNEGERVLLIDEILQNKLEDTICKTMVPIENRLFAANWKTDNVHDDSMATFAQLVTVTSDVSTTMDAVQWDDSSDPVDHNRNQSDNGYSSNSMYKEYYLTAEELGYFRGETYPFAIQFEMNDGHVSAAYPIVGEDEYDTGSSGHNHLGIYRFPKNSQKPIWGTKEVYILKAKFNLGAAMQAVKDSISTDALYWIKENVRSIHILRGDRYKTLEYQGVALYGCSPRIPAGDATGRYALTAVNSLLYTVHSVATTEYYAEDQNKDEGEYRQAYNNFSNHDACTNTNATFWGAEGGVEAASPEEVNYQSNVYIPLFRGYAPMAYKSSRDEKDEIDSDTSKIYNRNYSSRWFMDPYYICVFSPDFMFSSLADVSMIKRFESIYRTLDNTGAINGSWDLDNLDVSVDEYSDVYPRCTYSDQTGVQAVTLPDVMTSDEFTVHSVGDGIDHLPQSHMNGFINKMKDFWASDIETMFYATDKEGTKVWSNRSVQTPKYIGIHATTKPSTGNYNLDIVNLYNIDDPSALNITTLFNPPYVKYSRIGQSIDIDEIDWKTVDCTSTTYTAVIRGGGDCFLQRTYFKVNGWPGTAFYDLGYETMDPESEDETDFPTLAARAHVTRTRFTHGVLIGIVTENAMNTAMRCNDQDKSYYPFLGDRKNFAIRGYTDSRREGFYLNKGYNQVLSPRTVLGYDSKFFIEDRQRKNRIRFSEINDSTSLIDGFREFKEYARKDYTTTDGQIMRLMEDDGYLISICEKAINIHYVNERLTQLNPNSSEFVLGKGDILSEKVKKLANYGTQHKWSVVKGERIYGVDFLRRIIWCLGEDAYKSLDVVDLTAEKFVQSEIKDILTEWESLSEEDWLFSDSPISKEGIVGIWDPNNKEILFAFIRRGKVDLTDYTNWPVPT